MAWDDAFLLRPVMSGNYLPLFFLVWIASALTLPAEIDSVSHFVLQQEYDKALLFTTTMSDKRSASYCSLFVINSRMVDYESYAIDGPSFEKRAAQFIEQQDKKNELSHYYGAMVQGMRGLSLIKRGNKVSGALESRGSSKALEKLYKSNKTEVSLLQAVGLSRYYMASTFALIGGSTNEGLSLLSKAVASPGITSYFSCQSAIWVYIDEKNYPKSIAMADHILKQYPHNSLALRGKAHAQFLAKSTKAKQTVEQMLQIARSRDIPNRADQLSAYVKLIYIYKKSDTEKAKALIKDALALPLTDSEKQITWVIKHLKTIKKLSKDIL